MNLFIIILLFLIMLGVIIKVMLLKANTKQIINGLYALVYSQSKVYIVIPLQDISKLEPTDKTIMIDENEKYLKHIADVWNEILKEFEERPEDPDWNKREFEELFNQ